MNCGETIPMQGVQTIDPFPSNDYLYLELTLIKINGMSKVYKARKFSLVVTLKCSTKKKNTLPKSKNKKALCL